MASVRFPDISPCRTPSEKGEKGGDTGELSRAPSLRADKGVENGDNGQSIIVVCRVRPISEKEIRERSDLGVNVDAGRRRVEVEWNQQTIYFNYDAVIGPDGTQQTAYETSAKRVVDDFLEGFNGTVFAYGQTGSGKTHTIEGLLGDPEQKGVLPRVVSQIFDYMRETAAKVDYALQVQYLEIYNEKIRDLLAAGTEDLKVREDRRQGIYVEGARSVAVKTEREVLELVRAGAAERSVGETKMNQRSSRSHSIFICVLEQTSTVDLTKKRSKLFAVDLAGSEMLKHTGSEGQTLREAQHINTSLSALSNVINALAERNASHIPYRNSKLTRLLQEAIGGNCRTALIICCSPALSSVSESVSTLRFGRAAKKIRNRARVNRDGPDRSPEVEQLRQVNRDLCARLEAKEEEVEVLQAALDASAKEGEQTGAEAARRLVQAKEESLMERLRANAAEEASAREKQRADAAEEESMRERERADAAEEASTREKQRADAAEEERKKEKERADAAEAEAEAVAQLLEEQVNQYEEQAGDMQGQIDRLQRQVALLKAALEDAARINLGEEVKLSLGGDDEDDAA